MKVSEKIIKLRELMADKKIDAYVVPSADNHQSEYVGEHFKAREFITGFTGSAGTAVITQSEAGLWTDGRYFLQAEKQLEGSGVKLFKMGEPGVPTVSEYLKNTLPVNGTIGFDGRVISMGEGQEFAAIAAAKGGAVNYDFDLIDEIWEDRPALSEEPAFTLDLKYAGESTESKLTRIRQIMKDLGADVHTLATIDDICWILNIRGNDVEFFPLVLSYAVITMDGMDLYINESKLDANTIARIKAAGVTIHPYNDIYEDVKSISEDKTLLLDPIRINYALYNNIPCKVKKIEKQNPELLLKAVKNETEIANIRQAQLKDSVAHLQFMRWLKENVGSMTITEMSASDKLDEFRAEQGNFIRPSFEPICSFGEHAAIVHYSSTPETDVELKEGTLFLTDTGAGFYEGSTDITRTYALGEIPQKMKDDFTLVAISNLSLADAKFMYGCTGMNLDILARKPFWDRGLNFNHGTGHGVGYLLNIHEGPTGFRWTAREQEVHPFEEGMIITDEPGIYIAGSHGVRLENELLCHKGEQNEYGQFMYFEPLTYIPMDLDAINPDMMSDREKELLNKYHALVFEKISPLVDGEDLEFLKKYTRAI